MTKPPERTPGENTEFFNSRLLHRLTDNVGEYRKMLRRIRHKATCEETKEPSCQ